MVNVDLYTRTNPDGTVYHFRDDRLGSGSLVDALYPVGSIYLSVNNVSPATLFGGVWVPIKDTFLLAAGDTYAAGSSGGEAEVVLTTSEIPAHTHGSKELKGYFGIRHSTNGNSVAGANGIVSVTHGTGATYTRFQGEAGSNAGDQVFVDASHEHDSVGGGEAHNNMPPYLAIYVWQRTA